MNTENKQYIYKPLLIILILTAIVSCVAIASAKPLITNANPNIYTRQIMWYVIGFIAMFITYKFGSDRVYSCSKILYWGLMVLLVPLAIVQRFPALQNPLIQPINGSTCWYTFPVLGSFQPSEYIKMVILIVLANTVQEHNNLYSLHTFESDCKLLAKVALVVLPPCFLIYLQNDTGIPMIICVSVIFLLFSSGLQMRWFIVGVSIVLIAVIFLAYIFLYNQELFQTIFSGHRADRFYGWLDPEGTYQSQGYQLFNALLSYGTASIFGHGFQSEIMPFPEAHTDFIFAVICQGGGLVAGLIVLILILALDLSILKIGIQSDERNRCLATGLFGLLFIQQIWNISMIMGLLPITGITLPFISYGGSSLLSYMLMMGIIFDMEKQNQIKKNRIHSYE